MNATAGMPWRSPMKRHRFQYGSLTKTNTDSLKTFGSFVFMKKRSFVAGRSDLFERISLFSPPPIADKTRNCNLYKMNRKESLF